MDLKHLKTVKKIGIFTLLTVLILSLLYTPNINSVFADSESSGFNFFDNATDITPVADGTYKEIDVTAYVPSGTSGVILDIQNVDMGTPYSFWARKKGSTDDPYNDIQPSAHKYAYVGVDGSNIFEAKLEHLDIEVYLIGYTDDAYVVFFDNGIDYSLGVTGSYQDIDASADLPAGATGVIQYSITAIGNWDIRHPDSTDAVQGALNSANEIPQFGFCGVNSSRMYEGYISTTDIDFYIIGYTKGSAITWNVNYTDVSLGVFDAWTDIDATASTTAGATGVLLRYKNNAGSWLKGSSRIDGSTDDRSGYARTVPLGWEFGACGLDTGEIFEGYADTLDLDCYVIGYCEEVEIDARVYPDHVESSSGVITFSNNTMLDDDLWCNMTETGWIMWDFGDSIANVTRIMWEVTYGGGGAMWRMDLSNDGVVWEIVAQFTAEEGNPPIGNASISTRYDSEVHGRFRYMRIKPLKFVVNEYQIDYVCYEVSPPSIPYSDVTYTYPNYLEYIAWKIYGSIPADSNYQYRPYNLLGQNQSDGDITEQSVNISSRIVNQDYDPDNYVILRFADSMNITAIHTNYKQSSGHSYIYISNSSSGGWELVYDYSGSAQGWRGTTFTGSYRIMRYVLINSTDAGTNPLYIGATRVMGAVYSPIGGGDDGDGGVLIFTDFPALIGDALGIGVEAGGYFCSAIILFAFCFPVALRDRKGFITFMIGLTVFGFLVLLGWLPTWLFLVLMLVVAGIWGSAFSKWFGGRS